MLDFVTGEDDGFIPPLDDVLNVRIGGRSYPAYCPPDTKWHLFTALADGADWTADAVVEFLRASLPPEGFDEVMGRLRDAGDDAVSLLRLRYVAARAWQHYQPAASEHFTAMGMPFPAPEAEPALVATGAPRSRLGGERTPKEHTGARSVR